MAKSIALQTRALIQPVAELEFHWKEEEYYPASFFEIKNLGAQPLLLLDVKLLCHAAFARRDFIKHYTLWDEHIIPPGKSLCPEFDFRPRFEEEKLPWTSMELGYSLEVVAADLGKRVILTYRNIPVLSIVNVEKGMPVSVRWRYFRKTLSRGYYRYFYSLKRKRVGN
jgi:hypothetical protein